ncbi:MAG TPA: Rieske 2Fe-2S domain-containing protein [Usitatibacter sp.]|nr:Rieske 2Fe-2S domain-containing protein [Usitatibacter sp.]
MARDPRLICPAAALAEGGRGVRFELSPGAGEEKGFAVRYDGGVCAFVNRCPHLGTELDWQPGEFFEESGLYLVCSTHGALFEPHTGLCVAGPCRGASLEPLPVREQGGGVFLLIDKT